METGVVSSQSRKSTILLVPGHRTGGGFSDNYT